MEKTSLIAAKLLDVESQLSKIRSDLMAMINAPDKKPNKRELTAAKYDNLIQRKISRKR